MRLVKRLFDFYLAGSLHVALAVYALVRMTQWQLGLEENQAVAWFAFFGTVAGYNFVKYDELLRIRRSAKLKIRAYALLSLICFVGAAWCFFKFRLLTQVLSGAVLLLTALYTLPFFPNRRNARNWAGIKIYIVALCWVGVTVLLPVVDAGHRIDADVILKSLQRFILVFVLVLIFEIVDLCRDDPHLQTVPQQIGVRRTKFAGFVLMAFWLALGFLCDREPGLRTADAFVTLVVFLFLLFADQDRPQYYTAFWAESIPVLWYLAALAMLAFQ
jgi:uncharacterized membrane protein